MGSLKKIWGVISVCSYMTFFAILYTILRPFGKARNEPFKRRAREINVKAAKNLQCGANSVFVKLASGITLHVVEAGDTKGKLIVLLHGFPDCWHSWHGVIPALVKEGYFVVAPDMRGYNLSDKPKNVADYYMNFLITDVKELIESYNKKTATVIAHDWGGVVAWAFAAKHPEMLDKLMILNAPHSKAYEREARRGLSQLLSSWYIFWFQIPYLAQNLISYSPFESVKMFFRPKNKNALSVEDKEILACSYVQDGALPAMINYYKALFRARLFGNKRKPGDTKREKPQKIQTPTLVLWGQDDVALIPECAMCSEWVENVKVIYIPKCSHWVPYEVPEVVTREAIKFISSS